MKRRRPAMRLSALGTDITATPPISADEGPDKLSRIRFHTHAPTAAASLFGHAVVHSIDC
jgi:hypothetical protein